MAEVARLVAHRAAAAAPAAKEESPKRALADTKKAAAIVQQARPRGTSAPGEEGGGGGGFKRADLRRAASRVRGLGGADARGAQFLHVCFVLLRQLKQQPLISDLLLISDPLLISDVLQYSDLLLISDRQPLISDLRRAGPRPRGLGGRRCGRSRRAGPRDECFCSRDECF